MTSNATRRTYARFAHARDTPSHFSGVVTIRSARSSARRSGAWSPVSSTSDRPSAGQKERPQSLTRSRTSDLRGAMYTTLFFGCARKARMIASSAVTVLPEPVGAPMSTLLSVW